MPELPEVEVVKLGLEPLITGRQIEKSIFSKKPLRLPLQPKLFKTWLRQSKIVQVRRRAKYIILDFDNQANLVVHLGMTGKLGLFPRKSPRKLHDHACFVLDNDMELRFNDVRRFGSLQVVPPEADVDELFIHIGPEPFGKGFSAAYLTKKAKTRSQPVKNFIMDSRIVAGIGNIYANEILYESGVRPETPAKELNASQWKKIVVKSRLVLKKAIAAGGSTIADFVGSSGEPGYFQLQLNVYGRKDQKCRSCGKKIIRTVMAGRATYCCPLCQK